MPWYFGIDLTILTIYTDNCNGKTMINWIDWKNVKNYEYKSLYENVLIRN